MIKAWYKAFHKLMKSGRLNKVCRMVTGKK